MEVIHELYTDLRSPVCFSSAERLYRAAKEKNSKVTRTLVRTYLQSNPTYTKHHPRRRNFKRRQIIPRGFYTDVQASCI